VAEPGAVLRRGASAAVPALAIAYAVAAIAAVPRHGSPPTTYGEAFTVAYVADLTAGLALLAVGLFAWVYASTRRLGALAILAGIAWFGVDWDGWAAGPSIVRSLGVAAMPFFLAVAFHLAVAFPSGRLQSVAGRVLVWSFYGAAAAVSVGRALFRDPLLDLYCWRNCYENAFLVRADPGLARRLDDGWLACSIAIGLALAALAVWRLGRARGLARRSLWPILVPAGLVGLAEVAYAAALLHTPFEDPARSDFRSIFLARALLATALAAGLGWSVLRRFRTRAAVSRMARELSEAPRLGALRESLTVALDDPELQVVYWLPSSRRYVDQDGNTVEPPTAANGRAATPIVRGGQPVAFVVHDASLREESELVREIGASARLAVENERLYAEVLAQLNDLRASQARIIETGDGERRRLERDLHDGAQQRLLALSYELRLARAGADGDGDPALAALLTSALDEAESAMDDLRDLAHGIFPSVLTDSGVGPALATLGDSAPLPVTVDANTDRYPPAVETTAYVTVAEAIEDAVSRSATLAAVEVHQEGDRLIVTVEDDGARGGTHSVHVDDRIGALGGSVESGDGILRAEIPCA
jgi:signal transduction histidine kinase